jgi:hypothetical protein
MQHKRSGTAAAPPVSAEALLRDYLEALRALLELEASKDWPSIIVLSSLASVLQAEQPDLDREIDFLHDRASELQRARAPRVAG